MRATLADVNHGLSFAEHSAADNPTKVKLVIAHLVTSQDSALEKGNGFTK